MDKCTDEHPHGWMDVMLYYTLRFSIKNIIYKISLLLSSTPPNNPPPLTTYPLRPQAHPPSIMPSHHPVLIYADPLGAFFEAEDVRNSFPFFGNIPPIMETVSQSFRLNSFQNYVQMRSMGWVGERGWMGGWMGGWVDGWVAGRMDGWMGGWTDGWMDGWMDGWVAGRMDGRMDGWMGGWMDG